MSPNDDLNTVSKKKNRYKQGQAKWCPESSRPSEGKKQVKQGYMKC